MAEWTQCPACGLKHAVRPDGLCPRCGGAGLGPGQAPPPGQGPGPQGGQSPQAQSYGAPPTVPNYLVQSILVTLCCCTPLGIVSIVYAAQVNGKLARGDVAGAIESSNNAKTWAGVAFGLGLVIQIGLAIARLSEQS